MLEPGLYERLLDEELALLLDKHPELIPTLTKLDEESEPQSYAQFIGQLLKQALPGIKSDTRFQLVNRLIEVIGATDGLDYTLKRQLLSRPKNVLRQVLASTTAPDLLQPETPLHISSLLTGSSSDPQLDREIRVEMETADRVDILVSFIKWSGLSLLFPAFEKLEQSNVPIRIITTSYMGASDPNAVEWLAKRPNVEIRVSYDTERTRLHAKAYHFVRKSGYSTAYIGSANMSKPAMTSGLEWTMKVTAQDMPHILERFSAEFESYWRQEEFLRFDDTQFDRFRQAINQSRNSGQTTGPQFFADIKPHPFQERILESLMAARAAGSFRNLVVAATGTGKTVIGAFDYARFKRDSQTSRLLFVVHRKEILQQALGCFRAVLRDFNFGELLVDGLVPNQWQHVFASVQSINSHRLWEKFGPDYFQFVVVDEAHHGKAPSYRPVFDHLKPQILLGLTATPERMDGTSILLDFDNQYAAEIRLPEALEEKLLCPFHYFGVTDPVSTASESFWRNGRYDTAALENVYTGDDFNALNRLNAIFTAIQKYLPDVDNTRAIGFCAGVRHAEFMAQKFQEKGLQAEVVLGNTTREERESRIRSFRDGKINYLFTVDVFSEGVDIPDVNLVLFLRPTESLTVFLQQLGRGLRHAPGKDCLTVLDFVGQAHRKYRLDRKFAALLRDTRRRIDVEIENDFPNLPPGCSIQLERVAREHVLANIKESLGNLNTFIPEAIRTFQSETTLSLTFKNFIEETDLSPLEVLSNKTWSEWKDLAEGTETVNDPDLIETRKALCKFALRTDPLLLEKARHISSSRAAEDSSYYGLSENEAAALHYLFWSKRGSDIGVTSYRESFEKWLRNSKSASDLAEVIDWRKSVHPFPVNPVNLPFPSSLHLHAAYGAREINALFGKADLLSTGQIGVGVLHFEEIKTYVHLVTFRKEDRHFAPTLRYKDYPIDYRTLHWESQSNTTQVSPTGQNYIHFKERGYTILFFARMERKVRGHSAPYIFLGPASGLSKYESDRPIRMVWELEYPLPAELFEAARAV